jgi:hypothetical protein
MSSAARTALTIAKIGNALQSEDQPERLLFSAVVPVEYPLLIVILHYKEK